MTAPTVGTINQGTAVAANVLTITLTNAPAAGELIAVLAAVYTATNAGSWSCTASGGTGVTITKRFPTTDPGASSEGVFGWTIIFTTAPTSLSIQCSQGSPFYGSATAVNVSDDQTGVDVSSAEATTGTGTAPVATGLPDLTDASDLVLGVMTYQSSGLTIGAGTNWTVVNEIDEGNTTSQASNVVQRTPGATGAFDPLWTLSSSAGWLAGGFAIKGTDDGFVLEQTADVALVGELGVSGDIVISTGENFVLDITAGIGMAGQLAISGDLTPEMVFELTGLTVIELAGALGISGDLVITTDPPDPPFELVITASLGLAGVLALEAAAAFAFGSLSAGHNTSGMLAPAIFEGIAIKMGTPPAIYFAGAKGFDLSGALTMNDTPVGAISHAHGLPFDSEGSLVVVDKASATGPLSYSNGLQFDASGAVVIVDISVASNPVAYANGLAFDADGALVTTT